MAKPYLPNIDAMIGAGIDPKTGLPIKASETFACYKEYFKKVLRVNDEQICVNRYRWYNLPPELDGNLIERILYYKGQGMLFFDEYTEKFFFLPYTLAGEIDCYGRYLKVSPLPFTGNQKTDENSKSYFNTKILTPQYKMLLEDTTREDIFTKCVLLNDYSKQYSQTVLPRQLLNDGIIDFEAELPVYMRTSLKNRTGVQGMRVNSTDEAANALVANQSIDNAALNGQKYVPIVGTLDFQALTDAAGGRADEYLMAMQSVDNFRLSSIGVTSGGIFDKSQYVNNAQAKQMGGQVSSILQDGLTLRQEFCNIAFSIWGINIWCDVDETASMMDTNGDGIVQEDEESEAVNQMTEEVSEDVQ